MTYYICDYTIPILRADIHFYLLAIPSARNNIFSVADIRNADNSFCLFSFF